jgi:peroxiredoxin
MADEHSRKHTPSPGLWFLLAGGIAAGILMAVLTVTWGGSNVPASSASGSSAPTPIPAKAAIDLPAPNFAASTPGGQEIELSALRGSPVALNFWATWCVPCRAEMPELQSAATRYRDQGLVVLGVNGGETANQVKAYVDELKLTFPIVLDPDGMIANSYGVYAMPTTIWIDAESIIRAKHLGPLTENDIDRYMASLLDG